MSGWDAVLLVCLATIVWNTVRLVNMGLAVRRRNAVRQEVIAPHPLDGLDYQVRRAIECGESDAMLTKYAENVAVREWNATHPREEWTGVEQMPRHEYGGVVATRETSWTIAAGRVAPVVVPRAIYAPVNADCEDCEFETLTMFGGEVQRKVRTVTCPKHQEDR